MFFKVMLITIGCSVVEQSECWTCNFGDPGFKSCPDPTSWICSQQSQVQLLGHTCTSSPTSWSF